MKLNRYGMFLYALVFYTMIAAAPAVHAAANPALIVRGDAEMVLCNFDSAIAAYSKALRQDPRDTALMVKLARAHEGTGANGALGSAAALWENYLNDVPGGVFAMEAGTKAAEYHRAVGSEMFLNGDSADIAAWHLRHAIELNPSLEDAHRWLARVLNSDSRFEDAIDVLDRAEARFGTPDATFAELRIEAIEGIIRDGSARAAIERGIRLLDEGRPASALSEFETAGKLNSESSTSVNYWKGRSYVALNRFRDAERSFQLFYGAKPEIVNLASLREQAEDKAGAPMDRIAFYRRVPSLIYPKDTIPVASMIRTTPALPVVCLLR